MKRFILKSVFIENSKIVPQINDEISVQSIEALGFNPILPRGSGGGGKICLLCFSSTILKRLKVSRSS